MFIDFLQNRLSLIRNFYALMLRGYTARQAPPVQRFYKIALSSADHLHGYVQLEQSCPSVHVEGTFPAGRVLSIKAVPVDGYLFDCWSNGDTGSELKLKVDADHDIKAYFKPSYVYVDAVPLNKQFGTVTGGGSYLIGSDVTLEAVPAENYAFLSWSDGCTDAKRVVKASNKKYTAFFKAIGIVTYSPNY